MRDAPWLSIVIPTIGRDSLSDTLDSIDAQPASLLDGVEVLVVGDTYGGHTTQLEGVRSYLALEHPLGRYRFLEHDGGMHMYGQPQRTYGARQARGDWVWFTQDDNVASQGALEAIHTATRATDASRLLIFRWLSPWRELIWRVPGLELGNVDADCLVMRRDLAAEVSWGLRYEGDFDAAAAAARLSGAVGWCDDLISIARPDGDLCWWTQSSLSRSHLASSASASARSVN